ncbi:MAG: ABC transporter substrate-binding protein [Spirochaetaceae bacterium]
MRKILVLAVVAMLALPVGSLFAGGQGEDGDDGETMTLTMLEYQDVTDESEVGTWEVLLDRFYELNPNVELDIDELFDEAYHNKLQAMAVAEQLPDLMFLWPGQRTGQVTQNGLAKDLRPWLEGHEDEFLDIAMEPQGPNGEIYELPEQVTATHVMFTNEELLDELELSYPDTLEELLEQGETIRDAGYTPIAMDNGGGWQMQSCLLSALVERTGGIDWLEDAIDGSASFSDPEFVRALEVIQALAENDMFSPGINTAEYGDALTDFVNEDAVYFIDGGWRVNNLVSELSDEQKDYYSLNVFPEVPDTQGQEASTAMVAGTGYGMNADLSGEKADAAWEWIWFYSGPEGSEIRQDEGALPAYKLPVPEDADPMVKKLTDFVEETPAGHVLDAKLSQESMGELQPMLQEMILGELTPEEVADDFEDWIADNEATRE